MTSAFTWLDATPTRPFAFVHGYDAHIPYGSPPLVGERYDPTYDGLVHQRGLLTTPALGSIEGGMLGANPGAFSQRGMPAPAPFALSEADLHHIAAHYAAAVRKGDYALGRLLRGLVDRGIFDDAIVIVLADHGEELGEHGAFQHGNSLEDVVLHVPLVIHLPHDTRPARTVADLVSLIDLTPTLLDLVGVAPIAGMDGRSLRPLLDGGTLPSRPVRAATHHQYAVRTLDWWLGGTLAEGGATWRLRSDGAGEDVAAAHPEVVSELTSALAGWPADPGDEVIGGSPELKAALRDAGYWNVTGKP